MQRGTGGPGGGGDGAVAGPSTGSNATFNTGGGGGGGGMRPGGVRGFGGSGGSGIVVVRYQIGTVQTGSAKATGGAISFYGSKTIHTFFNTGTFTNTSPSSLSVDYIAIAGGGGAGGQNGGGAGGAGGVRSNIPGLMPPRTSMSSVGTGGPNALTITIGAGGIGLQVQLDLDEEAWW